jgi:hypothetical protein
MTGPDGYDRSATQRRARRKAELSVTRRYFRANGRPKYPRPVGAPSRFSERRTVAQSRVVTRRPFARLRVRVPRAVPRPVSICRPRERRTRRVARTVGSRGDPSEPSEPDDLSGVALSPGGAR